MDTEVIEVLYKDTIVVESGDNKVIVIEPKVVINQITGGAEQIQSDWNQTDNSKKDFILNKPVIPDELKDLTDDAAHRTVTDTDKSYWSGKANVKPTVLPVDTNKDTLITDGVYQIDYHIITVKVAENSSSGNIVNQVMTSDDGTMQYRFRTQYQNEGPVWNDWKEVAWWNYTLEELANKMDKKPTVLPVETDLNSLNTSNAYSIYQPVNAPISGSYQWYVSVISDGMAITQTAYNPSTKEIYFRMTDMMMWSGVVWQKIATEYDIATLYTALSDSISDVMDSVNNKVDKVAGKGLSTNDYTDADKAIVDKVAVNPANPENMYLNGNKEYTEIISGSGGYASNVFFTVQDSDIPTYKKIGYVSDVAETELTDTIQLADGTKLIRSYLCDLPIGISVHDGGLWTARFYAKISSNTGDTRLVMEAYMRATDGTETTLFSGDSTELNGSTYQLYQINSNKPAFTVEPTSRFGIRIYLKTTSTPTVTVNTIVGGARAAYFNSPIALRHSQLRDKNQESAYQHITANEKNILLLADRFRINATDFIGGTASPYQGIVIGGLPVIVKKFLNQNSYYYTNVQYVDDIVYLDNIRFILTESTMPTAGKYIDFLINGTQLRHTFTGTETQNQVIVTSQVIGNDDTGNQANTFEVSGTYLQKIGIVSLDFFYNRSV